MSLCVCLFIALSCLVKTFAVKIWIFHSLSEQTIAKPCHLAIKLCSKPQIILGRQLSFHPDGAGSQPIATNWNVQATLQLVCPFCLTAFCCPGQPSDPSSSSVPLGHPQMIKDVTTPTAQLLFARKSGVGYGRCLEESGWKWLLNVEGQRGRGFVPGSCNDLSSAECTLNPRGNAAALGHTVPSSWRVAPRVPTRKPGHLVPALHE